MRFSPSSFMVATTLCAVSSAQEPEPQASATEGEVEEPARVQEVLVLGRREELLGIAETASQGLVGAEQLATRPLVRPGEVLESVPGLVVTQHSGAGKANQFFLRGYNLDHGTDFLTSFEGVPINLPTHGHGQGYTDVNFLIPELIEGIDFRKGPYFARNGDFASAGSAEVRYRRELPEHLVRVEAGSDDYVRALAADSVATELGTVLYGLELVSADGPWENPDDLDARNGVLRLSRGDRQASSTYTLLAYDADWNATDQIPERAVEQGLVGRFGALDPTDGGASTRLLASADWRARNGRAEDHLSFWAQYYELELFSNFTFFLDDPVNGDQFLQTDQRVALGGEAARSAPLELFGRETLGTLGVQLRADEIDNGLFRTAARTRLSTTREDEIRQTSVGLWGELFVPVAEKVRATAGVRGDLYRFEVDSDDPDNSGSESDSIASPKLALAFGPWAETELYLSGGLGFHSNDGRGVLTTDDPSTPAPADGTPVDALVRTKGAELGVRTLALDGLQSTLSLWVLESDSEILFVGDAGTTEASRPSRRTGLEWANFATPRPWLAFDLDLSLSRARFTDGDPAGDHVPGSIESVLATGVTLSSPDDWYASLRYRYFGARPLIEDDSVRSDSSSLFNLAVGRRVSPNLAFELEALNLFDAEVDDISYFYTSRLAGEPAGGVDDVHFHPAEPFTLRIGMTFRL
jgi:hypothetical protein